jgi:GNAT superfamily N-acetyltransferase
MADGSQSSAINSDEMNVQSGSENYFVSTNKELLDLSYIYHYISVESYWAKNIPFEILKTSIEHSFCFGVYAADNKQVGFARIITDYSTYGYLADVFIDERHRGKGLSKMLMKEIMAHPQLQGLRRMSLMTRDAHGLYRQFGWGPSKTPENYMEIRKENPYETQ